ncbi:MAG: molybdenum cofactor biosynthesis protein MoaE [Actinobacteria bacterium]|nr:molybdenum cofactor biosynthesis protein MoaE [Actinomycetota bacterium]
MIIDIQTEIVDSRIDFAKLINAVESNECGAVATFSGNVRLHDKGRDVLSLSYEIHPSTAEVLNRVVQEVCARNEIAHARVAHRYGDIPIGEAALVVAVSSAHRQAAFNACSELVDEIKLQIPIWKHQVFADGTDEWVNCA